MEANLWRRPVEKMKGRRDHVSPLSTRAITLLEDLRVITGGGRYLFPHKYKPDAFATTARLCYLMRDLNVAKGASPHCWRTTFSTWANENGHAPDAIERQLAHVESNRVAFVLGGLDDGEDGAQPLVLDNCTGSDVGVLVEDRVGERPARAMDLHAAILPLANLNALAAEAQRLGSGLDQVRDPLEVHGQVARHRAILLPGEGPHQVFATDVALVMQGR